MKFHEIANMPTTFEFSSYNKIHESLFRSYQILMKVKGLLQDGVPPHITLELIEAMEDSSIWNKAAPPAGKGL